MQSAVDRLFWFPLARMLLQPSRVWLTPLLSAIGALTGIAGTLMLYLEPSAVSQVFAIYTLSNVAWIAVSIRTRNYWLMLMNATFLTISILGVLKP